MRYKWIEILRNGKWALLQTAGDSQYAVVSGYDPEKPEGSKWDHGAYFCYWGNPIRKAECLMNAASYFWEKVKPKEDEER